MSPFDLLYVKLLRFFCYPFGLWPGNALGELMPSCYRHFVKLAPLQAITVLVGELFYLVQRHKVLDFFTVGDVCITTFLTVLTLARTILPNLNQYAVMFRKFLKTFHLIHFIQKGDNFLKISRCVDKVSYVFTIIMISCSFLGMILFNLSPIWHNVTTGVFKKERGPNLTLRFSVLYEYPGFRPEDNFIFVTILNLYFSYACTTCVCAIDLVLCLMVFQIIGHIKILQQNLDDFPKPKLIFFMENTINNNGEFIYEKFDEDENTYVHHQLIENVNHHRLIVNFTDDLSSFFGPMISINYLYQLITSCVLLLECSQLDSQSLARFGPLTIISLSQLIEVSVIFEIVGSMSERLIDKVYSLPWQCMDLKNQRTVYIFFNRVQRTIHVTCMGMTPVGVRTMAAILKTTFSYFTFLQTIDI